MKRFFIYIMLIFSVFSCTEAIEKPKDILPKDKMSEIIADFAINEQSYTIGTSIDTENATRFILKKYNIKGQLFTESYKYYMTDPETMKNIMDDAQKIIVSKDPKAANYIDKKMKETNGNGTQPMPMQGR